MMNYEEMWPRKVEVMQNTVIPEQLVLIAKAMESGNPSARKVGMKLMELSGATRDLERQLRKMLGGMQAPPLQPKRRPVMSRRSVGKQKPAPPAPRARADGTLNEQILKHLARYSDDTFQAPSLTKALELRPSRVASVAAALGDLLREGLINRVGYGKYQGKAA